MKVKLIKKIKNDRILSKIPNKSISWMSHGDTIFKLGSKLQTLAKSEFGSIAIFKHKTKKIYGTQFHPEVVDETIQSWISIPKIKQDFYGALGTEGIAETLDYQQKNRRSLLNGAKLIYENWLNLIERN